MTSDRASAVNSVARQPNVNYLGVSEVWGILIQSFNTLLPPIDDDDAECFMAFPTEEDAKKALKSQVAKGYIEEGEGKVVKLR